MTIFFSLLAFLAIAAFIIGFFANASKARDAELSGEQAVGQAAPDGAALAAGIASTAASSIAAGAGGCVSDSGVSCS
jgi:hypothetical protein